MLKWIKDNQTFVKYIVGALLWLASLFGTYQKMKYDVDDIKKDLETANVIVLKANVDEIMRTNGKIEKQLDIVIQTLLNK